MSFNSTSNLAVRVNGLGKQYRISARQKQTNRIGEALMQTVSAPIRQLRRLRQPIPKDELFWALRDVSFEIQAGEAIGVIGRNGAGKSTLLKVLSRITSPTTGRVELHGRVGALLEVGTGFHSELSGRENTYLNGAILGMSRQEVKRKFDEIVAFAEIEQFIDTPVKRYSSGMYMRLAFAVAAHLEPDILIVDEVLAVGDSAFQAKCLGRMNAVASEGRTVIFVSHNMPAIVRLCQKGLLLEQGRIVASGDIQEVIQSYLKAGATQSGERDFDPDNSRTATKEVAIKSIRILNEDGTPTPTVRLSGGVRIQIIYQVNVAQKGIQIVFQILNSDGNILLSTSNLDKCVDEADYAILSEPGTYEAECFIPRYCLRDGEFTVDAKMSIPNIKFLDVIPQAITFEVLNDETSFIPSRTPRPGLIRPLLDWKVEELEVAEEQIS